MIGLKNIIQIKEEIMSDKGLEEKSEKTLTAFNKMTYCQNKELGTLMPVMIMFWSDGSVTWQKSRE